MTGSGPVALERRAHPRVPHRSPVDIVTDGQPNPIAASTVDVSLGGMRVTSTDPVPVGPCTIELGSVALVGEVLGQIIDVESGLIVSRIKFSEVPPAAHDHLALVTATAADPMSPPAAAVAAVPTRRFYAGIVAAAVLVIAVVAVALIARGGGSSSDDADSSLASTSDDVEQEGPASADSSSVDDEVDASADDPATDPATGDPSTDVAPSPSPSPATDSAPPSADPPPAPTPAPTLVTRTETADNGVQVELAEDPSQTAVASTVGPSTGVDEVKIQLDVIPEQQGTTLPVAVVIENRGDNALEFADGLTTTVTFTGADGVAHDVVLRAPDVTTLAPGERHELLGSIDFGGYGRFDVTATTPVGERA